jgi:hypothetical protein
VNAEQSLSRGQHFDHLGSGDPVVNLPPDGTIRDKPAVPEAGKMTRDIGLGTSDRVDQIGYPKLARGKTAEDLQTSPIGEASEELGRQRRLVSDSC